MARQQFGIFPKSLLELPVVASFINGSGQDVQSL
jgi:hypothetical protein